MTKLNSEGRLIAIGDIHGHAVALQSLLEVIAPETADTIVTLGDYVNRGPDSNGVLESLIELSNRCKLISILGNHEEMMLDARNDVHACECWKLQGGDSVLKSYGTNVGVDEIPDSHWNFLEACRSTYETEDLVFTHANYCWYSPMDQQPSLLLRWLSLEESPPRPHLNGKTFILGHTPGPVRDYGFCCCLDTGCGFGGKLTAMDVKTGNIWQVQENGTPTESEIVRMISDSG